MELIIFLPILSAIVSAIITTYLNNYYIQKREKEKSSQELKEAKIRLIRAFWAEITALFELYDNLKLEPFTYSQQGINLKIVNIQYDYLAIFNSNSDKIGLFPHEDAAEFVRFYSFAKSYIDSLRELSRRYKNHMNRYEKLRMNPNDKIIISVFNESVEDLRKIYQYCYEQQEEFYRRRDVVKKTFEKYL